MKRKRIAGLLFLLVFLFVFNSCSIPITTIDELILPPQAQALNEGIRSALESRIGSVYTLKTPTSGDNRSAFITSDMDGDGQNEAVAFYQLNNNLNTVHMMVFTTGSSGEWKAVQQVEGQGNGVYSVNFADFNNDGVQELVVGWEAYNNKLRRGVTVYSYGASQTGHPVTPVSGNLTFSAMEVLDMNEDMQDELLLCSIDSSRTPSEASARLYGYNEEGLWSVLGETVLDGNVTSYTSTFVQKNVDGKGVTVYVDGTKGQAAMITEKIIWNKESQTLEAPFYDSAKSTTSLTLRNIRVHTRDVNGDGVAEIAMLEPSLTTVEAKYASMIRWCQSEGSQLKTVGHSLVNFYDGYMVTVPDEWVTRLAVFYEESGRSLTISDAGSAVGQVRRDFVNIRAMARSEWHSSPPEGYTELAKNSDLVYVAACIDTGADVPFTIEELINNAVIYY